eukprot:TRINITY_DN25515_c0_g1_i1.p1 TRINITY_DN25515_c0_g1~~TRINITY_DN25515_c0_g1_i1.p1  ORF type:complete len:310 (+),score=36.09 TRINITY_DN25515_c0_g1_i1:85-930(+)
MFDWLKGSSSSLDEKRHHYVQYRRPQDAAMSNMPLDPSAARPNAQGGYSSKDADASFASLPPDQENKTDAMRFNFLRNRDFLLPFAVSSVVCGAAHGRLVRLLQPKGLYPQGMYSRAWQEITRLFSKDAAKAPQPSGTGSGGTTLGLNAEVKGRQGVDMVAAATRREQVRDRQRRRVATCGGIAALWHAAGIGWMVVAFEVLTDRRRNFNEVIADSPWQACFGFQSMLWSFAAFLDIHPMIGILYLFLLGTANFVWTTPVGRSIIGAPAPPPTERLILRKG